VFGPSRTVRIAVVPGVRCLENATIFSADEDRVRIGRSQRNLTDPDVDVESQVLANIAPTVVVERRRCIGVAAGLRFESAIVNSYPQICLVGRIRGSLVAELPTGRAEVPSFGAAFFFPAAADDATTPTVQAARYLPSASEYLNNKRHSAVPAHNSKRMRPPTEATSSLTVP
jgi:hypothetical protein